MAAAIGFCLGVIPVKNRSFRDAFNIFECDLVNLPRVLHFLLLRLGIPVRQVCAK